MRDLAAEGLALGRDMNRAVREACEMNEAIDRVLAKRRRAAKPASRKATRRKS